MPNIQVKLRRGTTSQHAGFTGAEGEVTVDTDKDTVIVHDGTTAGGHELRRKDDTIAGSEIDNDAVDTAQIAANAVTSSEIATDAVTSSEIATDAVGTDQIAADAVTSSEISSTDTTFKVAATEVVVNEGGADIDFRVEGNTNANLIVADAGEDAVGIATAAVSGIALKVGGSQIVNGNIVAEASGVRVLRATSSDSIAYLQLYSNGQALNQKRVNLVPTGGRFVINWETDAGIPGYNVQLDQAGGHFLPGTTGLQDLGLTGNRWDDVWSAGTFNGSDQNIKQDIEDLDEAEKRVAVKCKGLIKKYRMKDAVAKKGDDARIHVGIIAQELQAAFESEGLDAFRYSMIGRDTWWEGTDSEGNQDVKYEATDGYTEVTQMSVRYNELLAFIIAAM
jgi:hypothetical protein